MQRIIAWVCTLSGKGHHTLSITLPTDVLPCDEPLQELLVTCDIVDALGQSERVSWRHKHYICLAQGAHGSCRRDQDTWRACCFQEVTCIITASATASVTACATACATVCATAAAGAGQDTVQEGNVGKADLDLVSTLYWPVKPYLTSFLVASAFEHLPYFSRISQAFGIALSCMADDAWTAQHRHALHQE